ncbi:hypothetical protein LCGC14_2103810 [marine sediment metagenome]|uniref:Uncharacterized protein n=1 Tax=marine sediment metagenome TaxID=412755 RepID=A0A0F9E995_9ZZZZ
MPLTLLERICAFFNHPFRKNTKGLKKIYWSCLICHRLIYKGVK